MCTLLRSIICFLFLAPSLAAQPWRVDSTKITDALQDSEGWVWGFAYYAGSGLYSWEGDAWKPLGAVGFPGNAWPVALARGPDGAVYCLWNIDQQTHAVTWHKGTSSKLLTRFTGHLADRPLIFVDQSKTVRLTEDGRDIFRVSPQGKVERVYTIANNQFLEDGRPENDQSGFNPVYATADARGRIWYWSDCLAGGINIASLEGVLIFDGGKFEHHPRIAGLPDKKLSIVAPDDADHMWMAVADDQLYKVDINTLAATPVPQPYPQAFRYVQNIFHINQETYLVSGSVWQAVPERSGDGRSGALWRLRNGKWERLVNGLDMRPAPAQQMLRPLLSTEAGLWVGAFGNGPWFIPSGQGKRSLIDWHYHFPLDGSEGLFQLQDGRLLIVSANQGSIVLKPADLLAAFQSPPEVTTLNPLRPLIQDVRGHILGMLATDDNALSDWDGRTWTDHALPTGFDPAHFWALGEDSLDRIWMLPDAFGKTVAIFDPRQETFEVYPDYRTALQAQLPHRETFHLDGTLFTVPSFTPDGRICYRDEWCRVCYFDGRKWLRWRRKDIDGSESFVLDGPAFFDRAGHVAVNIERRTWEFTEEKGWHTTDFERGLGTDQERQALHTLPAPAGCEITHPESVVRDRFGTYWLTHRGQLYRAIPGLCVPQFSPQEHQPFIDSRKLKEVILDPEGNAFLETYFYFNPPIGEYVILKARPPLPKTTMHAAVGPSGAIELRFSARSQGTAWFTWRVDDGPWAAPTHKQEATLEWLSNGTHRIEAVAMDERLQAGSRPATAHLEIHVDPREQISVLIQKLADPDYSVRNSAVAALLRQPALALPLLRSARKKAGPDQQWWIDAVIQQIEANSPPGKNP